MALSSKPKTTEDRFEKAEGRGEGGVAAIDRAVNILGAFTDEDISLSLAELAKRTGLYKSTILRISESLIRGRLLLRAEDGNFRIGPEALRLGAVYQRGYDVSSMLMPVMQNLAAATNESVVFYVREGNIRVCLLRIESSQPVRVHVREGQAMPLEFGSGGLIILAFSGAEGEMYDRIRRQFYYISVGERQVDTAGIAVPVFGPRQTLLGSLGVSGPRSRFTREAAEAMLPSLIRSAAQATYNLGGNPNVFPTLDA